MQPTISVIIPHLNQEEFLRRCLASLEPQLRQNSDVEVIVVDNGSCRLPCEAVNQFQGVLLEQELEPGPGLARNKGVALSKGKILAFIDADCIAHQDWLPTIRRKLIEDHGAAIIGGDVRIALADPPRMTVVEAYESIYAYRQREYIEEKGFSGTGNLAMQRWIYDVVGPFAGINVAEDRDWGQKATRLGHIIAYVPDMIVYHPARKSFDELYRKWDRQTAHDYEFYASGRFRRVKWLFRAIAIAASPTFELVRILHSPRVGNMAQRLAALDGVIRVRFYRSKRMLEMIFHSTPIKAETWNRRS